MRSLRCPRRSLASSLSVPSAVALTGCGGGGGGGTGQQIPGPRPGPGPGQTSRIVALLSGNGGASLNERTSNALAINGPGAATGGYTNAGNQTRGFIYSNGSVADLGT